MKTYIKFLFVLFVIPMILTTGCKEEATDQFVLLKEYMIDNNLDLPAVKAGFYIKASDVVNEADGTVPDYYVLDLRNAADFATGHINGAVNTSLGDIVAAGENAGDKPIIVACYSGQLASHAVVALRLSGHPDAKILLWGMSGWNIDFSGPWLSNSGDDNGAIGIDHDNWTFPMNVAADATYDNPIVETLETEGAAILAERVATMTEAFKGVSSSDVLANPAGYFINNYWAETDTEHYGHIAGSHRINVLSLEGGEVNKLDPDKTIVTYCWTGQTSSILTAYLTVMGYDAKSLKYGANSMIYPTLEAHKFVAPGVNYIYE